MRNLKKVIALVAVFAMLISTVAFAQTFTDVSTEDSSYEAIETLNKLGILTGDDNDGDGNYDFRPNDTITRAEVAVIVARIQGNTGSVAQTATIFNDVPSSHWASGYIAMASNQGIVNGYGDGNFGPEDPVKYEEVIKMLMETLGWKPFADANGGYPTGYLAAAQRADILGGVSGSVGEAAPRGVVAQLTYNAIDAPMMDQVVYGTGSSEYLIYDGSNGYDRRTLMSQYLKVSKLNGIVTENVLSSLTDTKAIDTSVDETIAVEILDNYDDSRYYEIGDTVTFKVGDTDARDYLGYNVVFYVQQDRTVDDATIVSITPTSGKNQSVSFTLDQYEGLEAGSGNTNYLEYLRNSTDRTASRLTLDEDAVVIYNNFAYTYGLEDMFGDDNSSLVYPDCTMSGQVTVVDNDNVSGYDIVFVQIAASGVVDEITENGTLTFLNDVGTNNYANNTRNIVFDEEADDTIINITKDGAAFDPMTLEAWDVLTIITRTDITGYYYDIRVLGDSAIQGVVTSTSSSSTSDTGTAYTIDGVKYDLAAGYYANGSLRAGSEGAFYIDEFGKIVAYNRDGMPNSTGNGDYGYILAATATLDDWGNTNSALQMLAADGSVFTPYFATTVTIENATADMYDIVGESVPSDEYDRDLTIRVADYDNATLTALNNYLVGQLVTYTLNTSNQIRRITLPVSNNTDNGSLELVRSGESDYNERSMTLGGSDLNEDTIVFYINGVNEDDEVGLGVPADRDYSEVGTIADLSDGETYTYAIYDEDDYTGYASVVVVFNASPGTSASQGIIVIDSIGQSTVDGYDVLSVEYYDENGELQVATTDPDMRDSQLQALEDAQRGEAFKLSVSNGVISSAKLMITFTEPGIRTDLRRDEANAVPTVKEMATSTNEDEQFVFGAVVGYRSANRRVTVAPIDESTGLPDLSVLTDSSADIYYSLNNANNVFVFDPSRNSSNQLYMGGASDITFDENLIEEGLTVYTDRTQSEVLCETPAFGMLDYVFIRVYENRPEDVVVYKAFDYDRYVVD